ncbi:MAG TPA: putative hydroxymethylpyrimidine transporter CytX, partial [Ruminococcaceae bacterium]|nr:putative hydroxymethylpyrimidine transporter CytX [Oscillospiraceae bacterium]
MIDSGASAAGAVVNIGGEWVWCFIIGALITLWILVGSKTLNRLNAVAMAALFVVTILLCAVILKGHSPVKPRGSLGFGAAVELSVAMPLSWLPLISDYTRTAARPKAATSVSVVVYFLTSSWMYSIGMSAAVFTGESDIAKIMKAAGLGAAALLIIVFSTVTTTFLDVYSAGVSSESISAKLKAKPFSVGVCVIGTLFAVLIPVTKFEDFLYLIGSVFAPMIAILIADYFVLKKDSSAKSADISNLIIWAAGFVMYRLFMKIETPVGSTLPVMLLTFMICALVYQITGGKKNAKAHT